MGWQGLAHTSHRIFFSHFLCFSKKNDFIFVKFFYIYFFCKVLVVGALRACLAQAHNSTSLVKLFFLKNNFMNYFLDEAELTLGLAHTSLSNSFFIVLVTGG